MPAGLNDTLLNIGNAAMQTAATHAQLYTAEPNAAGTTNLTAAARKPITWVTAANGDMVATADVAFTGGAASGACTYVGLWSALTGGTFYGYFGLSGDTAFNSAGEYTLTSITITGISS
jgi:hypothetical protein